MFNKENILRDSFVHLHNHSSYSLLDGAVDIDTLVRKAKENGQKAIALTDHGNVHGLVKFQKSCEKHGVKPILGCEMYIAPNSRFDREASISKNDSHFFNARYHHLILLVKNEIGYKNLNKLVYLSSKEGFYYKPRIDMELLEKYSEGLVCTSACLGGAVQQAYLRTAQNNSLNVICPIGYEAAVNVALKYKAIFQDDYYLELQNHYIQDQQIVNKVLLQIAKEYDIKFIVTNDVHYVEKEDHEAHDILMKIQTNSKIDDKTLEFETNEFYLKSYDEMREVFPDSCYDDGFLYTKEIADKCNFSLEFGNYHLPKYEYPKEFNSSYEYIKHLVYNGLKNKFGSNLPKEYIDRANFELDIIKDMGFIDYFLIVWDFIRFAKENNIAVGPGRGSAAGSLVSYALDITNTNPMEYDLLFERFLNPERVTMPDIDIDFCTNRRDEVIQYVVDKYGSDKVAQIATFGTLSSKAVIKDVARVYDIEKYDSHFLTKLMKPHPSGVTIKEMLEVDENIAHLYETDERFKKIIDISMKLEGFPRHMSTHAAGVIIGDADLNNYIGTLINDGIHTTQFDKKEVEELGLLKMDFLGLRNLTNIQETERLVNNLKEKKKQKLIEKNIDFDESDFTPLDIDNIPINDKKTFDLLSSGETTGVFQVESPGMKDVLKQLKPHSIEELIAVISLYRPGPMDNIPNYIYNRNNPETIKYKHELLKPILEPTYGIIVYQEQVMRIFQDLGGFSLGRADIVRRAMSDKDLEVMEREENIFIYGLRDDDGNLVLDEDGKPLIPGALSKGVPADIASEIVDDMADFAKYAFNKSHAAAYAEIAYTTAYLKAHYPVEYMTSVLSSVIGADKERVNEYVVEAKDNMKLNLKAPDIEISEKNFSTDGKDIYYGLLAVDKVGVDFIAELVEERKHGEFKSFFDFLYRMSDKKLNSGALESLIKSGALDKFGNRNTLLYNQEYFLEEAKKQKDKYKNKNNLFEMISDIDYEKEREPELIKQEKLSIDTLLKYEYEALSFYASGHPLDIYYKHPNVLLVDEINDIENKEFRDVFILAQVGSQRNIRDKNNNNMAFLELEGKSLSMPAVIFSKQFEENIGILNIEKTNKVFLFKGNIGFRNDKKQLIINNVFIPTKNKQDFYAFMKMNNLKINKPQLKKNKEKDMRLKGFFFKVQNLEDFKPIAQQTKQFFEMGDIDMYIYTIENKQLIHMKQKVSHNFINALMNYFPNQTMFVQ